MIQDGGAVTNILLTLVLVVNGMQLFMLRDLSGRVRHLEQRAMNDRRSGSTSRTLFREVEE